MECTPALTVGTIRVRAGAPLCRITPDGLFSVGCAGNRLHDIRGKETNHPLAIALDAEQPLPLTCTEQVLKAAEPELALVERRIDTAHELLRLPHVHRETRRIRRGLEDAPHVVHTLGHAQLRHWRGGARLRLRLLAGGRFGVLPVTPFIGRRTRGFLTGAEASVCSFGHFNEHVAPVLPQAHMSGGRQLLRKVTEAADAVRTLRERGIELEERALQEAELRRHLTVAQHLQRPPDEWKSLIDRRLGHRPDLPPVGATSWAHQVLVRDELVAVALHDAARESAPADDEYLLVVLLQFLDEGDEITVAANDHIRVDVGVGKGHLQRIERQVDVGAVLVAARGEIALEKLRRVLRQRTAVVASPRPVSVSNLRDNLATFLQRFEHDTDVELRAQGTLHTDLDIVEIDEHCQFELCIRQTFSLPFPPVRRVFTERQAVSSTSANRVSWAGRPGGRGGRAHGRRGQGVPIIP